MADNEGPLLVARPLPPDVFKQVYGGGLIMTMLMAIFYGMGLLQYYIYLIQYKKDGMFLKILVSSVVLLDTAHTGAVFSAIYNFLIMGYAEPDILVGGQLGLILGVIFNTTIYTLVQLFFAWQITQLSKKPWKIPLAITLVTLVMLHFSFGIVSIVIEFREWDVPKYFLAVPHGLLPRAVFKIVSDGAITACLCVLLHGNRGAFAKTNSIINTLTVYAVNRLCLCTIAAIVQVVAYSLNPNSVWAMALDFIAGELYVNSILATLNSREHVSDLAHRVGPITGVQTVTFGTNCLTNETTTIVAQNGKSFGTVAIDIERSVETSGASNMELSSLGQKGGGTTQYYTGSDAY